MARNPTPAAPDAVLAEVRRRGDDAALLRRAVAPLMVRQAEHLHSAYVTAITNPYLFARGDANRSRDHELAERSIRAELAAALGVSESMASRDLDRASMLIEHLPSTRAALDAGRILWESGTAICDAASKLPEGSRPVFDERAAVLAEDLTPHQLRKRLTRLREELHEVPLAERHERAAEGRAVWVSPEQDGMALFNALLPAPEAMAIFHRADRMARSLRKVEDETRTLSQLRADVTAELLINGDVVGTTPECCVPVDPASAFQGVRTSGAGAGAGAGASAGVDAGVVAAAGAGVAAGADVAVGAGVAAGADVAAGAGVATGTDVAAGDVLDGDGFVVDPASSAPGGRPTAPSGRAPAFVPGIRAEVRITVPVLTAAGVDDTPADLDGYGPIPARLARELVGTASHYYRVMTDPLTDQVLSVDRAMRMPPENMRRFLCLRDGTCRFPGCTRPAATSEVDHTKPWQLGGKTSVDNLVHLCTAHHHVRHGERWNYATLVDGTLEWISPTGRRITTRPAKLPTSKRWPQFVDTDPGGDRRSSSAEGSGGSRGTGRGGDDPVRSKTTQWPVEESISAVGDSPFAIDDPPSAAEGSASAAGVFPF